LPTVITPEATIPTTIEVVVDELWMILVAKIPINNPTKGSEVVRIRSSAKVRPKPLKAAPIRPMLTRNRYRKRTTRTALRKGLMLGIGKLIIPHKN
jgi:hypothetical protein